MALYRVVVEMIDSRQVDFIWSRLLFAYETVYENACDPTVRHLEWKPEIKAALDLAAAAKED